MKQNPETSQELSILQEKSQIGDLLSRTKKLVLDLSKSKSNKGKIDELEGLISNLEQRYLDEQKESAYKYKLVFEHINSGLGFSNTKTGQIMELNPKFCEIFEIESKDYIGKDYSTFFNEFIVYSDQFEKGKQIYVKNSEISGFELTIRTKGGNKKHILVFSVGIKEINQEFFTIIDITAQKNAENLMKHELKGPLISIGGHGERLLNKGNLDEKQKKVMRIIIEETKKMEEMIADHFDFIKMERGEYEPKYNCVDLIELLKNIKSSMFESFGKKSGDIIFCEDEIDSDDYMIIGEEKLIGNLFSNLLKNAIEHSDDISKLRIDVSQDKKSVIIKIYNDQYIPKDIGERLLTHKYITGGKTNGTGLGVYAANIYSEIHGGKIEIESSSYNGTIFIVRLNKMGNLGK